MKTSSLAITLFRMLLATSVSAQSYSGFYITAGGSLQAMLGKDSNKKGADGFATTTDIDIGKNSMQGQIALGYLHKLSDQFSVGVEAGKQLGQGPTMNNVTSLEISATDTLNIARQWKMHPGWWLALKPSVNLENGSLFFIKLAKHWASGTFYDRSGNNCSDTVNVTGCESPFSDSFSASTNGTGIGAGLQTRLTEKLFLMIEVERISYGSISRTVGNSTQNFIYTDTLKPTAITGTISLGYWF